MKAVLRKSIGSQFNLAEVLFTEKALVEKERMDFPLSGMESTTFIIYLLTYPPSFVNPPDVALAIWPSRGLERNFHLTLRFTAC